MTLPIAAIERLFDRLIMTYGSEFKNKWDKVPLSEVKSAWSYELASFSSNLKAIGWALENLPEKCPNLIEFKNLCKQAPRPQIESLSAPKADSSVVDRELEKIAQTAFKAVSQKTNTADHKQWAKKLKGRHDSGEKLSTLQIRFYKEALEA
jgi:hypothetical protein